MQDNTGWAVWIEKEMAGIAGTRLTRMLRLDHRSHPQSLALHGWKGGCSYTVLKSYMLVAQPLSSKATLLFGMTDTGCYSASKACIIFSIHEKGVGMWSLQQDSMLLCLLSRNCMTGRKAACIDRQPDRRTARPNNRHR